MPGGRNQKQVRDEEDSSLTATTKKVFKAYSHPRSKHLDTAFARISENNAELREKNRARSIKNDGFKEFYRLRKEWSYIIKAWISGLIFFNIFITLFIGFGILDYQKYKWFIISITMETFLQIVGMGYIAVKFLFSSQQKDNVP